MKKIACAVLGMIGLLGGVLWLLWRWQGRWYYILDSRPRADAYHIPPRRPLDRGMHNS